MGKSFWLTPCVFAALIFRQPKPRHQVTLGPVGLILGSIIGAFLVLLVTGQIGC